MPIEITGNETYTQLASSMSSPEILSNYINDDDFLDFSIMRCFDTPIPSDKVKKQLSLLFLIQQLSNSPEKATQFFLQMFPYERNGKAQIKVEVIFTSLIEIFHENLVHELHYSWLQKTNARQSLFIQAIINHIMTTPGKHLECHQPDLFISPIPPVRIYCNEFKKSNDAILGFKKFFLLTNGNIKSKIIVIYEIKAKWEFVSRSNTLISWLKNEKHQKKLLSWIAKREFTDANLTCEWLLEQRSGSMLKSLIAYFDTLTAINPDKAELTAIRLKKAWSQAKTRDKNKDNIQFNFILAPTIKNLLKEVCDTTGMSRNAFVEMAIKNEYKRFKETTQEGS